MYIRETTVSAILLLTSSLMLFSCEKTAEASIADQEVLMQVGDSMLTRQMVTSLIPPGLSAADSLRMFDALVEAWVDRNMLVTLAGSQLPDIERIERMVELYREQLLANEYRRIMATEQASEISQQDVVDYYESHPEQFRLQRPLVKGIYLKVAHSSPRLNDLREWMESASETDIDNLENYGLRGAMEYDYFGNSWIDWQAIDDHIPYRFENPDSFVSDTSLFEWEDNGSVYMLRILDYILSGEIMPLSFAETDIKEQLMEQHRNDYDRRLLNTLYSNGVGAQTIKPGAYIPLKYRNQ